MPGIGPQTRILDIGCGTGCRTLVLARGTQARILAVDHHPPFVDVINREAARLGIVNRLEARVADMRRLDFADGSFDLIWCEGAIYNVGSDLVTLRRSERVRSRLNGAMVQRHRSNLRVPISLPSPSFCARPWQATAAPSAAGPAVGSSGAAPETPPR